MLAQKQTLGKAGGSAREYNLSRQAIGICHQEEPFSF